MGMCSALGMYAPEVQASNGEANSLIATSVQQTKKVTGNISDSMGPLIGATIKEKGTSNGVVTDLEGNFSINVKPGATLVISYVGYNTKEVVVGNQTNIKISMEEEGHSLNDVVVIGYGTQRKEAVTGSVANLPVHWYVRFLVPTSPTPSRVASQVYRWHRLHQSQVHPCRFVSVVHVP